MAVHLVSKYISRAVVPKYMSIAKTCETDDQPEYSCFCKQPNVHQHGVNHSVYYHIVRGRL